MKKFDEFLNYLQEVLETDYQLESEILSQNEVKEILKDYSEEFPMICHEYTPDSQFEVSIDESKFLNDESHDDGKWLFISNIGVVNLVIEEDFNFRCEVLDIDVFEINENYRDGGFARKIISAIEHCSKNYFERIKVIPFDTNANNFWKHLEYEDENNNDVLYKENRFYYNNSL